MVYIAQIMFCRKIEILRMEKFKKGLDIGYGGMVYYKCEEEMLWNNMINKN